MMRIFQAVLLFALCAASAVAQGFSPFEGPRPLAVMIESNPWLMVMGSDTPSFVLYENGQVIYRKTGADRQSRYMTKQLSPVELVGLKARFSEAAKPSVPKRHFNLAPHVTDQPETKFYVDMDGTSFVTTIYGLASGQHGSRSWTPGGGGKGESLPQQLIDLHVFLSTLEYADATEWAPRYIEAMVWGYDYAPEGSIHWPKEWPGLTSATSIRRGDAYSIFLPGSEQAKLRLFLDTRKEKGAVEIDGGKWIVSVRDTFPGEPVWTEALRRPAD
jgi:hypothetical protein